MSRRIFLLCGIFTLGLLFNNAIAEEGDTYYARCNLKVIKGNYVTWINWQAAPEFLPVGTKFKVKSSENKATLTDVESGNNYTLEIGAKGDEFLEKFVTKDQIRINKYPKDIQGNIEDAVARIGMNKEQVYIAMGPPAWITNGDTNNKTYEDIMSSNLWVYKRSRFGKNIVVEFNPSTGIVTRTEGIWR